ncbi:MAG: LPXTG cell wall anchor domain-containing protein [Clostridia bacterium]|nr:LPXTG cell wall anchor domain-containing protein [Clostridia bacterium]
MMKKISVLLVCLLIFAFSCSAAGLYEFTEDKMGEGYWLNWGAPQKQTDGSYLLTTEGGGIGAFGDKDGIFNKEVRMNMRIRFGDWGIITFRAKEADRGVGAGQQGYGVTYANEGGQPIWYLTKWKLDGTSEPITAQSTVKDAMENKYGLAGGHAIIYPQSSEQYYDYRVGVFNENNGVRITFKINDELLWDVTDTDNPFTEPGYIFFQSSADWRFMPVAKPEDPLPTQPNETVPAPAPTLPQTGGTSSVLMVSGACCLLGSLLFDKRKKSS